MERLHIMLLLYVIITIIFLLKLYRRIKVADFNVSRVLTQDSSYTRKQTGTPGYQAPEMLDYDQYGNVEYTFGVDAWGLGCVLYELCMKEKFVEGITREGGREGERMVKREQIANDAIVRHALLHGIYPHIPVNNGNPSSL